MNFSVPKEYEDFVTNAGDLLDQFNSGSAALETVSYRIHTCNGDLAEAVSILNKATSILEPLVQGYLWHNECFRLVVKVDAGEPVSLMGTTCIGECIEDEWFIVYLLIKLSQEMPSVVVSIVDTDGQFLLMEAADYIDDWIGPENADNRVWLRGGSFFIIPFDEPGKLKSGGMILNRAIKCMLDGNTNQRRFKASEAFHRTIYQRTLNAFPARTQANRHTALCIVPGWLATLIRTNPQVVARAVVEFHNADKDQLRQACAASTVGKRQLINSTTAAVASSSVDQSLVLLPVQFTRALYAQLTFKNFHPPRKYHAMMRRVAEASSRKVSQAFDIGCRLACGVDCAYYFSNNSNSNSNSSDRATQQPAAARVAQASNPAWLELLAFAQAQGYATENSAELEILFQTGQISSTANFERSHREGSVFVGGFKSFVDNTTQATVDINDNDQEESDRHIFRSIIEGTVRGDEDAWLFMTPEELDKEMQTRVDRFAAAASSATSAAGDIDKNTDAVVSSMKNTVSEVDRVTPPSEVAIDHVPIVSEASEEEASAASLQAMLDGFKSFMEGSSDVDGISFGSAPAPKAKKSSASLAPSMKAESATDNSSPAVGSFSGDLELDYAYLETLMQNASIAPVPSAVDKTPVLSESEQAEELARVAAEKERADLSGYFSKEDLRPLDSDDEEGEEGEDSGSDDDADDAEGAAAADQYLESILHSSRAGPSNAPNVPAAAVPSSDGAVLGVGGGFLSANSSNNNSGRRRGATAEVVMLDSDDEPEPSDYGDNDIEEEDNEEEGDDDELDEDLIREYQVCTVKTVTI